MWKKWVRNPRLSTDEMHNDHPELIKDQYWDEIFPNELPYTSETMAFKERPPMPSTANIPAALNARQGGKFDEMVGKSVYPVNYKFPDCDIEVRILPGWQHTKQFLFSF